VVLLNLLQIHTIYNRQLCKAKTGFILFLLPSPVGEIIIKTQVKAVFVSETCYPVSKTFKTAKCSQLSQTDACKPVTMETFRPISSRDSSFLAILDDIIYQASDDVRESALLFQRLSVCHFSFRDLTGWLKDTVAPTSTEYELLPFWSKVDLIILEGKMSVRPYARPSVRPQKVSSIWMKFGM